MDKKGITYGAEEYARTKKSAEFRDAVEFHTIFSLIGNPTGLHILDAGCGDGIYARELIDRGASRVIGVDCAQDFIDLAKEKNKGYESKIEYHLSFMQDFFGKNDQDLIVGSFVLSYPRSLEEAVAYCTAMASHLKEGGRFIGFNNNPFDVFKGERYAKYGFRKVMNGDKEGSEIVYWVEGRTNPIVNYYLHPETYERAFKEAGFSKFEWTSVQLEPSERENEFWEEFLSGHSHFPSPFVAMVAEK